jgi:hypothetical protein
MAKSANRKLIEQPVVGAVAGGILGFSITKLGWHRPSLFAMNVNHFDYDLEFNRVSPPLVLWQFLFVLVHCVAEFCADHDCRIPGVDVFASIRA